MSPREDLIASLEQESTTSFLELATKHYSRADPYDLQEIVEQLNKDSLKQLWKYAEAMCHKQFLERTVLDSDEDDLQQEGIAVLRGIAALVGSVINIGDAERASHAIPVLEILHGLLPLIPDGGQDVQNSIAKMFEKWWQNELPQRESVVPHTVPYLLIKTLVEGSKVSDILRLWSFRQAILILDFEDITCDHLKSLLLQCLIHPLYLQAEEGRRFLSFLFGLHPSFTDHVHATIKQNIPNCPRPFLEAYGELYFRAWRSSAGVYLEKIENDCIQDLMHHAVHAQRSGSCNLSAALMKVLGYLHQQKVVRGMDSMLLRLYDPILWRALKVANVDVRANAASLLIDAFPLQNPESTREENDELIQKQITVLLDLLADPAPVIRTMGVTGICRVLGIYWELIPSATLQTLLKRLIKDMSCDMSSSAVRASVFHGLSFVVENPLSHPVLAKVLPELKLHIHDTSERVRSAFIQLLLAVRNVRMIKFWDVVPMDHLLHRLAVDRPSIVRSLVKLLYVSYQPISKEGEVQLIRCVELIRANPAAARKFFQFAHVHMSTSQAGKFILFLCRTLRGTIETETSEKPDDEVSSGGKGKKKPSARGKKAPAAKDKGRKQKQAAAEVEKDKEVDDDSVVAATPAAVETGEGEVEEVLISGDNEVLIAGLLECMVIIWQSILQKLKKPGCQKLTERLEKEFSNALPAFFDTFKSSRARAAILLLSGNVPAEAASALSTGCLEMLTSMPSSTLPQEYAPVVGACCSWDRTGEVLQVLHSWLTKALHPDASCQAAAAAAAVDSAQKRSRRGRKGKPTCESDRPVQAGQEPVLQGCFALDVLTWMLVQPTCREKVLAASKPLDEVTSLLKSVLDVVEEHVTGAANNKNQASDRLRLLRAAFCMYTRLQVHLHAKTCKEQSTVAEREIADDATGSPSLPTKHRSGVAVGEAPPSEGLLLVSFRDLLDWANNVLLKGLANADEAQPPPKPIAVPRGKRKAGRAVPEVSSVDNSDLNPDVVATCILQELLTTCAEITVLGLADRWFLVGLAQACCNLVDSGKPGPFVPYLCKLLFQLSVMFHPLDGNDSTMETDDDPAPFLLTKLLQWLQDECVRDEDEAKERYFPVFQSTLSEVIRTYHRRRHTLTHGDAPSTAMAAITMAIVGMVTGMAEEEYARDVCSSSSELPALSGMLLRVVTRTSPALRSFLEQLQQSLDLDALDTPPALMAVVHISSCLQGCGQREQVLQLVESLQRQVSTQSETSLTEEHRSMLVKAGEGLKVLQTKLSE